MTRVRADNTLRRRVAAAALVTALVVLLGASAGAARVRPKCFGKPATIVGSNGSDRISGTRYSDVIVARGGNDVIKAKGNKANHGRDVICGGPGNDEIQGNGDGEKISGGPGHDLINGAHGDDLIVGDDYSEVSADGRTGRDHLLGGFDRDFIVGDNLSRGDAKGSSPDWIGGNAGGDTVIGDSASFKGDATGGAPDHVAGATGDDIVIGDSYSAHGTARGSGDDKHKKVNKKGGVDGGPGNDLLAGDNYTFDGTAIGGGNDAIHSADGGDAGARCVAHECDDVQYGDNYVASCGRGHDIKTIRCQDQATSGGGFDLLTADQGNDFMNGGPPDNPDSSGQSPGPLQRWQRPRRLGSLRVQLPQRREEGSPALAFVAALNSEPVRTSP